MLLGTDSPSPKWGNGGDLLMRFGFGFMPQDFLRVVPRKPEKSTSKTSMFQTPDDSRMPQPNTLDLPGATFRSILWHPKPLNFSTPKPLNPLNPQTPQPLHPKLLNSYRPYNKTPKPLSPKP